MAQKYFGSRDICAFPYPTTSRAWDSTSMMKCERTWFINTVDTWLVFNFSFQEILLVCGSVQGFSNKSVAYQQNTKKFLINSDAVRIRHIYLYHISKMQLSKMLTYFLKLSQCKEAYMHNLCPFIS